MGEANSKGKGPSKNDIKQMSQSTSYTPEEIQDLYKEFKELDKDNSGELDKNEFKGLFKKRLANANEHYLESLFQAFDTDGSGTVSFKELLTSLACISKGNTEQKLKMLFDIYDEDHSGTLTMNEVQNIVKQMKSVAEAMGRNDLGGFIEALVKKIDSDGSGTITRDEWMKEGLKTPTLLRFSSFSKT